MFSHVIAELARAAFKAMRVDDQENVLAKTSVVVPLELPQTAPVSERCVRLWWLIKTAWQSSRKNPNP